LLAPTIGAVTPGWWSSHAKATCTFGVPRFRANFSQPLYHRKIRRAVVMALQELVRLGADSVSEVPQPPLARHEAARQRAKGRDTDALLAAQWNHLPLLFPIDEVVMILHYDESRQPQGRRLSSMPWAMCLRERPRWFGSSLMA